MVTYLRKKGVAKTLPSKAHATLKERTGPAELPEDDPYDFDIGLTGESFLFPSISSASQAVDMKMAFTGLRL